MFSQIFSGHWFQSSKISVGDRVADAKDRLRGHLFYFFGQPL